jgi:nitrogenase molybdenum-iron protein alpha/beta subunit
MVALLRELGADVSAVALTAATYHRSAEEIVPGAGARPVLFEAPFSKLQALITETFSSAEPADLLIADGRLIDRVARKGIPFFEMGYPSFFSHATTDTPIYGFRGALAFASAIANRLHLAQLIGWSFGRGPSAAP